MIHPFHQRKGVTIVELMVVMAIVASLMALGAYSLGMVGGNQLQSDTLRMASVIKYTYANACLNNTRYRLVMELGTGNYHTEITDEPVITASEQAADEEMLTEEARDLAKANERENDLFDETEENPFGVNRRVTFERVQDIVIKQTKHLRQGLHAQIPRTTAGNRPCRNLILPQRLRGALAGRHQG
jgi:prepilin-type N-terminal cleavage/methylation domain-containing protein